jgi:hypothetical protein
VHKLRLAHDEPRYAALRAGTKCVCCNAEASGHREPYGGGAMFSVPVCRGCVHHALGEPGGWAGRVVLVATATLIALIGLVDFSLMMVEMSAVVFGAALIWRSVERARLRRWHTQGHHPGMEFDIGDGYTVVSTHNAHLVDQLLTLHPTARVERGDELPRARAVKLPN